MTAGDRFKAWIDSLSVAWGKTLGSWAANFVMGGMAGFSDKIGLKASEQLAPLIARLEAAGIPPELKLLIDEIKKPTGEFAGFLGSNLANRAMGSIDADIFRFIGRGITQAFSYFPGFYLPRPEMLIGMYFRGLFKDRDTFIDLMRKNGLSPDDTDALLRMSTVILPSDIVLEAWLRNKPKYQKFIDALPKLGLDTDTIELLKELAYKLPTAEQAITWMAREVFEPEMTAKYGLDDEADKIDYSFMETIGIQESVARKHWRAHWQHASWSQIVTMLHRGQVTEQDVYDWFRLVEIPPYWRKGLTATMWNVPGRVEARMLAQYGLIDKPFLVDLLKKDGLAEEYRDVVADMMLVRGIRTDIQTRYMKGWLNSDEVRTEIAKYNLSPQIADRLYQWIVKNAGPERTAKEFDLTKAEIVKGVKKGLIEWNDGIERLVALGYDRSEAAFIMAINIEAVVEEPTSTITVQTDTIRRQRRQRLISKEVEVSLLISIGLDPALAQAYADNDDLRLVKATAGET